MTAPEPSPRPAAETDTRGMDAELLARLAAGSTRLYGLDFLGRRWLAEYVADVDTLAMAMEDQRRIAAQGEPCPVCHDLPIWCPRCDGEPTAAAGDGR